MLNGDQHDLDHGSVANERRWALAYLKNQDIVSASVFFMDEDAISIEEVYG